MKKIIASYLETLSFNKSPATRKTYTQGIKTYILAVGLNAPVSLSSYIAFLKFLAPYDAGTQHVYRAAVWDFYSYYCNEHGGNVNLLAMRAADKRYLKKLKKILNFDRPSVNMLVDYAVGMKTTGPDALRNLRDKAFILLLVDSGLRISEACALTRGDVPWQDKYLYIVGKGEKEAKVYFSDRALVAIKQYLDKRAKQDGTMGVPLDTLPLFARHDHGAGKKTKPIAAGGMWYAFCEHMKLAGIQKSAISPHKLRHEAITRYLEGTGDIRRTMEFSRHSRIDTVAHYTHLTDKKIRNDFDRIFNRHKEK